VTKFDLERFSSDQELAGAVAKRWLAAIPEAAFYAVALSGGRIARRLFSEVARTAQAEQKLRTVQFFWGDERCVPPADAESNYAAARELLFVPLQVPPERIHRIPGEAPPEEAAREAEADLRSSLRATENNQPVLDLVFLGMGEDGHVASLFPGEPREMVNDTAVYRPVIATKPPPRRITLGYQAIFVAREVWVLASGAGKEQALRDSIASNGDTPLARVLKNRRHTTILSDIQI
jgi:6-phosphogluconolactonase